MTSTLFLVIALLAAFGAVVVYVESPAEENDAAYGLMVIAAFAALIAAVV